MATPQSPAATPAARLREQAEALAEALPPLLAEAEHVANTVSQGVHGRRRSGLGEAFWQFRRFREGDEAASIDWRRSARSRHLFVRETESEAAEAVYIWRDGSASMDYRSDDAPAAKRDRATVLAFALATLLIQGGERVAVLGEGSAPGTGRAALRQIAHRLIDSPDPREPSLPVPAALPRHAQLVLISDFLAPAADITALMKDLSAKGIRTHLVQVLDPAEEDFPFEGRTEFEGVEETLRIMVGRAQSLRQAYHDRLETHRNLIRQLARELDFTFAAHRTDRPPQAALLALYTALAGSGDMGTRRGVR
ncbi:MAG: DUF58 domain-containing protein [Parvibaculaceae bacterium]|nr:DUF58 domain-containing protein [Parvibaculaceae bacterium]